MNREIKETIDYLKAHESNLAFRINELLKYVDELQIEKENYKSRNEKAIELINAWLKGLNNDDIIILLNDLGNILKGSE